MTVSVTDHTRLQPPQPTKSRSLGKLSASIASLAPKASVSSLSTLSRGRLSDTATLVDTMNGSSSSDALHPPRDLRKKKSGILGRVFRSKSKPRPLTSSSSHSDIPPLPSPEFANSFQQIVHPPPSPTPTKVARTRGRKKAYTTTERPSLSSDNVPIYELDTNLDEMDGIVNLDAVPAIIPQDNQSTYTSRSRGGSTSSTSHYRMPITSVSPPPSFFSNPEPFRAGAPKGGPRSDDGVPPNTKILPAANGKGKSAVIPVASLSVNGWTTPDWAAPESWAVVDKDDQQQQQPYSDDEEELKDAGPEAKKKRRKTASVALNDVKPHIQAAQREARQKPYRLRVYRANNTYHVVTISQTVTVEQLIPSLVKRLLLDSTREPHKLYISERGRGK
jgi:adenylate cyclase